MNVRLLILLAVAVLGPSASFARQWTDNTGQYHREGQYVRHDATHVWLRGADGRKLVVLRERLSDSDRQYVEQLERPTAPKGQIALRTLTYRTATKSSAPQQVKTAESVARLTGWRCHGGHCYVTVHHQHPHPSPVPPAPPTSDKRIYTGCYCTFHLVCRDRPPAICGTGAYKFLVGGNVSEYLVRLRYVTKVGNFLLYSVADAPAPLGITHWYFEDPAASQHCYRIYYYSPATGVQLYDRCAHRRFPL